MDAAYQHFTSADFVCDDAFLKHQLTPTDQSTHFWAEWLQKNADKKEDWEQAVHLLEAVRLGLSDYTRTYLSEEAEARLLARILATNAQVTKAETTLTLPLWRSPWLLGAAAACLALVLVFSMWYRRTSSAAGASYEEQVALLPATKTEVVNPSPQPKKVSLPDGSQVWLAPQSRLSYAPDFNREHRTLYLVGEATFDVTKNPAKPFYVFAGKVVTKVLGTRFVVKAYEQAGDVVVQVEQGQVSVYRRATQDLRPTRQALDGVLLQPNQQVVFSLESEQFTKTIVDRPALLPAGKHTVVSFVFDETPVVSVLERLKATYGIDIIYNAELLADCQLTASLTEETLFQKLDVITQSIGASYEVVEGQVIITGRGCKNQ
ncbi:FecR family protein [Tellurirhabdus rosea]|uniref:FecR family protein n=1 Tax=Tellurirhabdus rosea TaxID=2674997 RepID=UPI002258EA68|nr:FecR family protein [Tellurirhabdus rosea]